MRKSKNIIYKFRKILLFVLVAAIGFMAVKFWQKNIVVDDVLARVEQAGLWAPVWYFFVYILVAGIIVPAIALRIFAGTLFGMVWGLIIVSIAATISSLIKFLLARYMFREAIKRKIEASTAMKAIDEIIEEEGWKILVILRNIPVVNSALLNYICGLTKMKTATFVVASFFGRMPTTVMYVYLGYIVRYAYKTEMQTGNIRHLTAERILLFIGLAAVISGSVYMIHLSKKVLRKKAPAVTPPDLKNEKSF